MQAPSLLSASLLTPRYRLKALSLALQSWLQKNTFAPRWLPKRWRHPLGGYLVALVVEFIAASLTLLVVQALPIFALQGMLVILGIVLVALNWGAGPGILATLMGTTLLELVVLPPYFPWILDDVTDGVCIVAFLVIGFSISLIVGQSGSVRRQAEEMARSLSEEQARTERERLRLRTLFDVLPAPVGMVDAQGQFLERTPACKTLWGEGAPVPREIADYQAARAWWPDSGKPLTVSEWAMSRALAGGEIVSNKEVEIETSDGQRKFILDSATPIRDEYGAILGAVGMLQDITERKHMEQHTRETLNALLAMAEELVQAPDQVSAGEDVSPGANQVARRLGELTRRVLECQHVSIVAVEPETAALTPIAVVGLSVEQEQQWWSSWNGYSSPGLHLPPNFVAALRAGEPVLFDTRQPPLPLWQHLPPANKLLIAPMRLGETLIGVLKIDCGAKEDEYACPNKQALIRAVARLGALVLDRERLLREREEARASEMAMRESTQQMDTFLGMAGHELKTPLTSIKLAQQLAERRIRQLLLRKPDVASELAPLLDQSVRAGRQAERLDRLVNDLLDVSRVQAGKLELYTEPADLTTIVHDAVEEQRQVTPARTLILHLPADLHVPVIADAARIGQAVTNYLTNALKYSTEDRPVEIGIDMKGQRARVWVRDQGPGLPVEEQERIWECFHRIKGIEVQSGTGIGLGLGLHICRTIIERHQGQVGVESAPGQGSTFWFTLPLDSQRARSPMYQSDASDQHLSA